jgi:hypothetical protein
MVHLIFAREFLSLMLIQIWQFKKINLKYRVSQKTVLLRFFGEKFQKIFFQKSPIRGIFVREIDCAHLKPLKTHPRL